MNGSVKPVLKIVCLNSLNPINIGNEIFLSLFTCWYAFLDNSLHMVALSSDTTTGIFFNEAQATIRKS